MKKIILFILSLFVFSTCNANIYLNSLNFYPFPPQYKWCYDADNFSKPPFGMEIYKSANLRDADFYNYTQCRMLGATNYIGCRYTYMRNYNVATEYCDDYYEDICKIFYFEDEDITKCKFALQDSNAIRVQNRWDCGTHEEYPIIVYGYTTKPKSQMTEKEKFHRAIAEGTYMFHFHKEFFGKEWLCADNSPENIAKFTSANEDNQF